MWQDFVFMVGSSLSIVFLAPTLRDATSRVPLGTSLPSMAIGFTYATTFATLGMTFSAVGALASATMWSLIATFRSPVRLFPAERPDLFVRDAASWLGRLRSDHGVAEQYVPLEGATGGREYASRSAAD